MPTVHFPARALIEIAGPQAEHFLQNVLTNDFSALQEDEVRPGALLTPQGKILFDFLVSRSGADGFLLESRADIADGLLKRLILYRLRAKAEISKRSQDVVAVSWETDSMGLADRRFPDEAAVRRHYGSLPPEDASQIDWDRLRIAHAVPESGTDYTLGDAFPHEVLFDQNGGVGLSKGCYVGQEVVSRMQHRGTARRRLLIAHSETALPASGTAIEAGGRPLGTLGTVVGSTALAIARIDRVKNAMDAGTAITADGAALELTIPQWARFSFPENAGEAEA
jgi:folate-binding protein YgfZ